MHLPDCVEPFVESDPGRWRVTAAVGATIALALLNEADARVTGYLAAVAIGAAAAWLLASRSRDEEPSAALPRLPVFLRFDDRRVVVVGGGAVAAAKIPALLAAGARVTVIAPAISGAIDRTRVEVIERPFELSDLDGAWFVTAAATPAVNRQVRDAAESRGVFVNAVDDPANATAYLGGTVARGGVTVAFSTSGQAPALAGLLREAFDELLPEDVGTWMQRARELSTEQRRDGVPMSARRPLLLEALNDLYEDRRRKAANLR
jgi:siroheme synthase-like protein